jgi:hypothetical protein
MVDVVLLPSERRLLFVCCRLLGGLVLGIRLGLGIEGERLLWRLLLRDSLLFRCRRLAWSLGEDGCGPYTDVPPMAIFCLLMFNFELSKLANHFKASMTSSTAAGYGSSGACR